MRTCLCLVSLLIPAALRAQDVAPTIANFRMQEIDTSLTVGYAVLLADLNGDGKPDIVVVDSNRVIWFENPSWKLHVILQGQSKPDNVCMAAADIDGDGRLDLALGSDWGGINPKREGTLYWLGRGADVTQPWKLHPIGAEPTVHRIRFADLDGRGKPELIVVPLLGKTATAKNNWMDGAVRTLAYPIPKDPVAGHWQPRVLDESLHVIHNFWPTAARGGKGMSLLMASYEGVGLLEATPQGQWHVRKLGVGNQSNPNSNRGASEIKMGKLRNGESFIATIEPWHGNQVVVYTPPAGAAGLWERHVVDDRLKWGHAVWCADLDGDGNEELIIGVRDNLSAKPDEKCGVRIYKAQDNAGKRWARQLVDAGGVAIEDLAAADLDGDGKVDLVAVGRQTHNIRIYWNLGKP